VSVYHTKASNLIGLVTDPTDDLLVYANAETARSSGVELAVEGQLRSRLFTRASYAYQQAEEGDQGARPVNSPRHLAHLATSLSLLGGRLSPGLELHYVGARATLAGADAKAYTLASLTLQLRPTRSARLELFAKVDNLFDTAYFDPGGEEHVQDVLARDGRTAWLRARFRF